MKNYLRGKWHNLKSFLFKWRVDVVAADPNEMAICTVRGVYFNLIKPKLHTEYIPIYDGFVDEETIVQFAAAFGNMHVTYQYDPWEFKSKTQEDTQDEISSI